MGGIICHAITCYTLLSSPTGLNLSVLVVSHLVCLAMLALVAASTLKLPVQNLNLFLYPLAIILLIATMLFGPGESTFTDVDQYLATHILISVAGAIGAVQLQSLAQCLNSAGHASDSASIELNAPKLLNEAKLVLDFVEAR